MAISSYLAASAVLMFTISSVANAEACCNQDPRKIEVDGRGFAEVVKNLTVVNVRVYAENYFVAQVSKEISDKTRAVLAFLETKSTVSKVEETYLNVNAIYNYDNGYQNRYVERYGGSNSINFELSEVTGEVLDGIQQIGARVENIYKKEAFDVFDAARKQAVVNAVENAKIEAELATKALGEVLGKPLYSSVRTYDWLQWGGGLRDVARADVKVVFKIEG